jgi:hypothetical protein
LGSTLIEGNNWGSVVRRLLLVTIALSFAIAPVARGDNKPPKPDSSAVSQYVEMVPTASGSSEAGVGTVKAPLSARARWELRGAPATVANALRIVGTSSAFGAPSTRLKPAAQAASSNRAAAELQRAFSGAVAAGGAGGTSNVFALGAFLLVVTAAMVSAAARKQTLRRRRPA